MSGTGYPSVMDTATEAAPSPLNLADRCDRCGAQAFVRATLPSGSLLFCNHHGRQYEDQLVLSGASIYREDVSERVNDTDH